MQTFCVRPNLNPATGRAEDLLTVTPCYIAQWMNRLSVDMLLYRPKRPTYSLCEKSTVKTFFLPILFRVNFFPVRYSMFALDFNLSWSLLPLNTVDRFLLSTQARKKSYSDTLTPVYDFRNSYSIEILVPFQKYQYVDFGAIMFINYNTNIPLVRQDRNPSLMQQIPSCKLFLNVNLLLFSLLFIEN